MKVLGINGSPRGERSGTGRLVAAVLKGASEQGAEAELLHLVDHNLLYRNACSICFQPGDCVMDDDFPGIFTKITEAEGVVLGSPVYFDHVTGQMKLFIDRMADGIQCQSLTGKYGCAIATSGDHAEDAVVSYLNHVLQMLGADPVGGLGIALKGNSQAIAGAEKDAFHLGVKLASAIETGEKDPGLEAFHQRFRNKFRDTIAARKSTWPRVYDEWVDKAWVW